MAAARQLAVCAPGGGASLGSLFASLVGERGVDELLCWPADVFALVERALDASEAYRFVVSPPGDCRLSEHRDAGRAAVEWLQWLDAGDDAAPPQRISGWWRVVCDAQGTCIDELATGGAWAVTEALLALHATADEACAGLGSAITVTPGAGRSFRTAARELLAETGSLARLSPGVLRVLPRCRTSVAGISIRSLSRHVFVAGPQIDVEWHRMLSRPRSVPAAEGHANVLLLPWPMRVRTRDFHPVRYTLPQMDPARWGFFEFRPEERLDLDLVERVLLAAIDEAGTADVVFLPESSITPADIEPLEALLGRYGVWCLIAGVREEPSSAGGLGGNRIHVGIRQELVWRHASQHKHHRWRLDGRQVRQYHLGGALSAGKDWWEAVAVPRRSLHVVDQGAVAIVALLCEDLARLEPVSDLVRSIGPSLVVTLLLDGPQLGSRWTARYASVLADDPGSAVCTLTSYGMVRRCRPAGLAASKVVALWKDASGELTEIELDDDADAVLVATNVTVGDAYTADGRRHRASTSTLTLAAVQSLRAAPSTAGASAACDVPAPVGRPLPPLDEREVSKATSWVEAFAEAVVHDPASLDDLFERARAVGWRAELGLPPPTRLFLDCVAALEGALPGRRDLAAVAAAADRLRHSSDPASLVTGTVLDIALEQRLVTEVQAGRLAPEVLDVVAPR